MDHEEKRPPQNEASTEEKEKLIKIYRLMGLLPPSKEGKSEDHPVSWGDTGIKVDHENTS